MHRHRSHHGFTLVELLVVISIIAVLLSILTPTLSATRESARRVICLNNLRSLGIAVQMYRDDHDGSLPYANYQYSLSLGWTDPLDALGPYLAVDLPSIDEHGEIVTGQPFLCPSDPGHADQHGISYGYFPAEIMGAVVTPEQSERAIAREITMFFESGPPRAAIFRDMGSWHAGGPASRIENNAGEGRNSLRFDNSVGWSVDDDWR